MWLVLSAPEDESAYLMAERLRTHGLAPLIHASAEDLGRARWCYRTGGEAEASEITLPGGEVIASSSLRGVLNRLYAVPASALAQVERADRDYAREELYAMYTSWLYGLACPVINRAGAIGLCGNWPDRSWWRARAFSAGLPTDVYFWQAGADYDAYALTCEGDASMESVTLLDGQVIGGDLPPELASACARFAEYTGSRLLGLVFSVHPVAGWRLLDANPMPDLAMAGTALVEALARALGRP